VIPRGDNADRGDGQRHGQKYGQSLHARFSTVAARAPRPEILSGACARRRASAPDAGSGGGAAGL
ncbi:MAG: hypothetical protein ACK5MB_13285, partial [Phycisphaerales bacterium]